LTAEANELQGQLFTAAGTRASIKALTLDGGVQSTTCELLKELGALRNYAVLSVESDSRQSAIHNAVTLYPCSQRAAFPFSPETSRRS